MSTRDLEVLQAALDLGPAAHGWDDQRWTLARICKVVHDLFKVEYSVPGMCLLLHRIGWSVQAPARRSSKRDDAAVETWGREAWPQVKARLGATALGSASRTNPGSP